MPLLLPDLLKIYIISFSRWSTVRVIIIILSCFTAVTSHPLLSQQGVDSVRLSKIIDGDTYEVITPDGMLLKVRLIGVDCPESRKNSKVYKDSRKTKEDVDFILLAGVKATEYVKSLVALGAYLRLESDVQLKDRYGRILAYVYLPNGRMLNEMLLEKGYASLMTVPPNVKYVDRFRRISKSETN